MARPSRFFGIMPLTAFSSARPGKRCCIFPKYVLPVHLLPVTLNLLALTTTIKSPVSTCGVYSGLCFPRRRCAILLATRPVSCFVASTRYHLRSISAVFAEKVFILQFPCLFQVFRQRAYRTCDGIFQHSLHCPRYAYCLCTLDEKQRKFRFLRAGTFCPGIQSFPVSQSSSASKTWHCTMYPETQLRDIRDECPSSSNGLRQSECVKNAPLCQILNSTILLFRRALPTHPPVAHTRAQRVRPV